VLTQLGHITVLVNDYDEALEFYTKKLGFTKLTDIPFVEPTDPKSRPVRWLTVAPENGSQTAIIFVEADNRAKRAAVGKQAPGHVFLTVHTSDIAKDSAKLKRNGVVVHGEPRDVPWGKEVDFEDLYGNLFDLVEWNAQ
jgi:catechol 2,3-dioxygenase-like lactoylglutathione lyase family enzyme